MSTILCILHVFIDNISDLQLKVLSTRSSHNVLKSPPPVKRVGVSTLTRTPSHQKLESKFYTRPNEIHLSSLLLVWSTTLQSRSRVSTPFIVVGLDQSNLYPT